MNIKHAFLAIVPALFLLTGCTTTNPGGNDQTGGTTNQNSAAQKVEAALPYVKPAVALACTAVLEAAVSDSDRVEKAKMIHDVAAVVRSLTGGSVPTVQQLDEAISNFLPEKTHWTNFADSLSDVYQNLFRQINGDPALALKVLNAIADGCVSATQTYLNQQPNG
ncbi:MAG: hypothetical protein ACOYNN_15155 [Terrimicrobiaceae bacterium]